MQLNSLGFIGCCLSSYTNEATNNIYIEEFGWRIKCNHECKI